MTGITPTPASTPEEPAAQFELWDFRRWLDAADEGIGAPTHHADHEVTPEVAAAWFIWAAQDCLNNPDEDGGAEDEMESVLGGVNEVLKLLALPLQEYRLKRASGDSATAHVEMLAYLRLQQAIEAVHAAAEARRTVYHIAREQERARVAAREAQ